MKDKKTIENLLITDIADRGQALGKDGDKVIFVDRAIPGDLVDVLITRSRKNYAEGRVKTIRQPSPLRVNPFCSHFGVCGGCKWQDMADAAQLRFKEKQVRDAMQRIAKAGDLVIDPIIPSEKTRYYRNKLEFTFSDRRWLTAGELADKDIKAGNGLGFHMPGRFDKILNIQHCYLQPEPSNEIRLKIKTFTTEHGFVYWNPVDQTGFLRNLVIRTSSTGEVMVVMVFAFRDEQAIGRIMGFIRDQFPSVTALLYVINEKKNDSLADLPVELFHGRDHIYEKMQDLLFRIGGRSFFQTNSGQAETLYSVTRDMAGLTGKETVYDLYTGTGTIACYVASRARKVIGVEYVPEAIDDARINASINGITNCTFFAGDMKDVLIPAFFMENGNPDVIILDPPRAGLQEQVIPNLLQSGADRIVYVSCNPSTQARDMLLLSPVYEALKCQPVDMFPHTHHVENIVLLKKK